MAEESGWLFAFIQFYDDRKWFNLIRCDRSNNKKKRWTTCSILALLAPDFPSNFLQISFSLNAQIDFFFKKKHQHSNEKISSRWDVKRCIQIESDKWAFSYIYNANEIRVINEVEWTSSFFSSPSETKSYYSNFLIWLYEDQWKY